MSDHRNAIQLFICIFYSCSFFFHACDNAIIKHSSTYFLHFNMVFQFHEYLWNVCLMFVQEFCYIYYRSIYEYISTTCLKYAFFSKKYWSVTHYVILDWVITSEYFSRILKRIHDSCTRQRQFRIEHHLVHSSTPMFLPYRVLQLISRIVWRNRIMSLIRYYIIISTSSCFPSCFFLCSMLMFIWTRVTTLEKCFKNIHRLKPYTYT